MASSFPSRACALRPIAFVAAMVIILLPMGGRAQAPAPSDNVFEMPGVFRITLAPGWQKTKVIDDRLTVAAFSSKDLTMEVMRDVSRAPVEQYAQTIPDRRLRDEADDYPGVYLPVEAVLNPAPLRWMILIISMNTPQSADCLLCGCVTAWCIPSLLTRRMHLAFGVSSFSVLASIGALSYGATTVPGLPTTLIFGAWFGPLNCWNPP
jgi:hypothetical protein